MNEINRREFLKLGGTAALMASMLCTLGGCSGGSGGGSGGTVAAPSPAEEEMAQRILSAINEARRDVGLDGTVQPVDEISRFAEKRSLERMNGKTASEVPAEFKINGKCYKYGGRSTWTKTGFSRGMLTKEWLVNRFRINFQSDLDAPGETTIREDLYVGIGVQEQDDRVWYDIIYVHQG